jgi:hypothetical protein
MHFLEQIISNRQTKKSRVISSKLPNPFKLHFVFYAAAMNSPLELILVHYVSHNIPVLHEARTELYCFSEQKVTH